MVGHDDGAVKIVGLELAPSSVAPVLASGLIGGFAAEIHRVLSH